MIEHAFTKRNIQRSIAYKDMINDIQFRDIEHRNSVSAAAFKEIQCGKIFSKGLKITDIAGKKTYQFHSVNQELVSRLISKNIRANYGIKQLNRQVIINNVVSILKESSPFNLYRFDIVSFFETVDRKSIIDRLIVDGRCSRQTILLLKDMFNSLEQQGIRGLPRGIGISSVLAEFTLDEFDRQLREEEDVFFYARFVDDIIIITSNLTTKSRIQTVIEGALPPPLKMHKDGEKVSTLSISKTSAKVPSSKTFEYLGYKFSIGSNFHSTELVMGNKRREVKVEISTSKILKIKYRLIDSFTNYISGNKGIKEYAILKNRIKALTGNFYISDPVTGIQIKTGIFFNYSEKNHHIRCELQKLDAFLRGLVFCKKHRLSIRIGSKLSLNQKKEICGFSFLNGFHTKAFYSFSHLELREIKEGWKK
jgi:hypothetical protein